jgi:hypothetical protein
MVRVGFEGRGGEGRGGKENVGESSILFGRVLLEGRGKNACD